MRHLTRGFIAGCALISATFVNGPVKANLVTLVEAGVDQGTLTDGSALVTFLGYISPTVKDASFAYISNTTTVNPADPSNLVSVANTWFGTSFVVADDFRTNTGGVASLTFDVFSHFFSLTIGMQQTAFFENQTTGPLHLTYTAFPGVGGGLSHYDQYAVPGPIVGAGLPGLTLACATLIAFARRRRKSLVA